MLGLRGRGSLRGFGSDRIAPDRIGADRTAPDRIAPDRIGSGRIETCARCRPRIPPHHHRPNSDHIGSDRTTSDQIGSGHIRSDRITSDQIRSDRIGSDLVRSAPVVDLVDDRVQSAAQRPGEQLLPYDSRTIPVRFTYDSRMIHVRFQYDGRAMAGGKW